jgi:hypothetical protein
MRTILLALPSKLRRSYELEARIVFWKLLITMVLSSVLLLLYLRTILNF